MSCPTCLPPWTSDPNPTRDPLPPAPPLLVRSLRPSELQGQCTKVTEYEGFERRCDSLNM